MSHPTLPHISHVILVLSYLIFALPRVAAAYVLYTSRLCAFLPAAACDAPGDALVRRAALLVNGWQSFSFTGALGCEDVQPVTSLPRFSGAFHRGCSRPLVGGWGGAGPGVPLAPGGLASEMFAALVLPPAPATDEHGAALVAGFLSQHTSFGAVAVDNRDVPNHVSLFSELGVTVQPGSPVGTEWAMVQLIDPSREAVKAKPIKGGKKRTGVVGGTAMRVGELAPRPIISAAARASSTSELETLANTALHRYLDAKAAVTNARASRAAPVGWCSWYCHGPKVNEGLMRQTLATLAEMAGKVAATAGGVAAAVRPYLAK